jgi:hypothetical protein
VIKAQTERIYTHRGSFPAGIFSSAWRAAFPGNVEWPQFGRPFLTEASSAENPHLGLRTDAKNLPQCGQVLTFLPTSVPQLSQKKRGFFAILFRSVSDHAVFAADLDLESVTVFFVSVDDAAAPASLEPSAAEVPPSVLTSFFTASPVTVSAVFPLSFDTELADPRVCEPLFLSVT